MWSRTWIYFLAILSLVLHSVFVFYPAEFTPGTYTMDSVEKACDDKTRYTYMKAASYGVTFAYCFAALLLYFDNSYLVLTPVETAQNKSGQPFELRRPLPPQV